MLRINNKNGVVLIISILMILVGSMAVISPVAAQSSGGELSIETAEGKNVAPLAPGDRQTLNVVYDSPPDIDPAAISVIINYDENKLDASVPQEGDYLGTGEETGIIANTRDSTRGIINYTEYNRSGEGVTRDRGTVASITFEVAEGYDGQATPNVSILSREVLYYQGGDNPVETDSKPKTVDAELVIDTVPPEINNPALTTPSSIVNEQDELTISADGIIDETSDVASVKVGVQSDDHTYTTEVSDPEDVEDGITLDVSDIANDGSDNGEIYGDYTGYIRATDSGGNVQTATDGEVTIDTQPPQIQAEMTDLGETNATLRISVNEETQYKFNSIDIQADGDQRSITPSISDEFTDENKQFEFDGTPTGSDDTVFVSNIGVEDEAGNSQTHAVTSTVTSYEVTDNGTASISPDAVNTSIDIETAETNTSGTAVVSGASSPPPDTEPPGNLSVGEFIQVNDIGIDSIETAEIRVPVTDSSIPNESLDIFYSSGETSFRGENVERLGIEKEGNTRFIKGEVDSFSTLVAVEENTPPDITGTTVTPGTEPAADTDQVTVEFEYNDDEAGIDREATDITTTVDSERVTKSIRSAGGEVTIDDIQEGEAFTVDLTVVDNFGASRSASERIAVQSTNEESENNNDDNGGNGGSGGGGAGGGGGGTGGGSSTADTGPPSFEEIRSTLGLVDPAAETEASLTDNAPDQVGLTVTLEESESVAEINFNNENLDGTVSVTEYNQPPRSVAEDIIESAAADLDAVTSDNDRVEVVSLTDISPTVESTEDSSAVVKLTVPRDEVSNPDRLSVIKETYSFENQRTEWQRPETTVQEVGENQITIETTVDKFSLFAVVEGSPESDGGGLIGDNSGSTSDGDGFQVGQQPLVLVGAGIVFALVVAVPLARKLRTTNEDTDSALQSSQSSTEERTGDTEPTAAIDEEEFEWDPTDE